MVSHRMAKAGKNYPRNVPPRTAQARMEETTSVK